MPTRTLTTFWAGAVLRPSLGRTLHHLLANRLGGLTVLGSRGRRTILRLAGLDIGKAMVAAGCYFGGPQVRIGDGTFVNRECFIDNGAPVWIGDRVSIGMRTLILTGTHDIGGHSERAGPSNVGPVRIEDGCWVGASVTILPGVTIGTGCVIATSALVTRDCEPDWLYGGAPARRIRSLSDGDDAG